MVIRREDDNPQEVKKQRKATDETRVTKKKSNGGCKRKQHQEKCFSSSNFSTIFITPRKPDLRQTKQKQSFKEKSRMSGYPLMLKDF